MAKKKSKPAKSSPATKPRKPAAGKAAKKSPPARHGHQHDRHEEEIELDAAERKAVDLVRESDALCDALEVEVSTVVMQAVRKICKAHGAALTVAQAQNVALVLFGD